MVTGSRLRITTSGTGYPRSVYPGRAPQATVIKARSQQANPTRRRCGLPAQACPGALRHSYNAVQATKRWAVNTSVPRLQAGDLAFAQS